MKEQSKRSRLVALSSVAFGAMAAALGAGPAHAQDEEEEAIVVTGSRIVVRDNVATSPIETIGGEDIREMGASTVETYLNSLPQFAPSLSRNNNNPQGGGAGFLDLRQLGSNRGLVLVDGRRIVPATSGGTVDISTLPPQLIERVEIITGGASATYGSDAISGVINFILRDDFEGLEITTRYGETTEYGDGSDTDIGAMIGGNFADGRGNAVFAASYNFRDSVGQGDRPWTRVASLATAQGFIPAGSPTPPDGTVFALINPASATFASVSNAQLQAIQAQMNLYFAGFGSPADNVWLGTTPGNNATLGGASGFGGGWFGFNPGGANPTLFGTGGALGGTQTVVNYLGSQTSGEDFDPSAYAFNFNPQNMLLLPITRYNVFSRLSLDLTDNITTWAEVMFSNYTSETNLASSPVAFAGANSINPNLMSDANKAALLGDFYTILQNTGLYNDPDGAGPLGDFPRLGLAYRFTGLGPRQGNFDTTVYQLSYGLEGEVAGLTESPWRWDIFGSYARYQLETLYRGYPSTSRALAAARGCSNAPPGPGPCVQADLFGEGDLSPAARLYIEAPYYDNFDYERQNVQANLTGDLIDLWAGPLSFAIGGEYRRDYYRNDPDGALLAGDIGGANRKNLLTGEYDVLEWYGEVRLPLLRDLPLMHALDLEAGYRLSEYSTGAGEVETWKIGGSWSPTEWLRFRAIQQQAIRAPSIGELYLSAAEGFPGIPAVGLDPCSVNSAQRLGADGVVGGAGANADGANAAQVAGLCAVQAPAVNFAAFNSPAAGQYRTFTGGNPDLRAETADTFTYGVVFRMPDGAPSLLESLTFTVDRWEIAIEDAVGAVAIQTSLARCFDVAFNPAFSNANPFCANLNRDQGSGLLTSVSTGFVSQLNQNLAAFEVEGIDITANYTLDLPMLGAPDWMGDLGFSFTATQLDTYRVQNLPGNPFNEFAGTTGAGTPGNTSRPEWKHTLMANWDLGDLNLGWRWVRIGEVTAPGVAVPFGAACPALPACGNTSINNIPAFDYHFFNASWSLTESFELYGGVDNVFDQEAPLYTGGFQYNTDPSTYDVLGRFAYMGVRLRY